MNNKKVYIVDDDKIALMLTENTLNQVSDNLHVSSFVSSVELLDKFKKKTVEQPDIFIVDINMPVITGFEIINALVELPHFNRDMKIYVQSSAVRDADLTDASRSKHINHHYEKYMSCDDFKEILQN
jgi:CheY-like chemotaxis protein